MTNGIHVFKRNDLEKKTKKFIAIFLLLYLGCGCTKNNHPKDRALDKASTLVDNVITINPGDYFWLDSTYQWSNSRQITFKVKLQEDKGSEMILAFSNNKLEWPEKKADALTFRISNMNKSYPDQFEDVWRTGVFKNFVGPTFNKSILANKFYQVDIKWDFLSKIVNVRIFSPSNEEVLNSSLNFHHFQSLHNKRIFYIGFIGWHASSPYEIKLEKE